MTPFVLKTILIATMAHLSDLYPNGLTGPVVSFPPLGNVPHVRPTSVEGTVTLVQGGKAVTIIPFGSKVARSFAAHGPLARGGYFPGVIEYMGEGVGYLISDLRAGDIVDLHFVRVGKYDRVIAIQLLERPAGKVPPSRVKLWRDGERYHDIRNALIAKRNFGTPLPKFLQPSVDPPFPSKKK